MGRTTGEWMSAAQDVTMGLVSALLVLLALADFFDLLDAVPSLQRRVPILTLLGMGLLLAAVVQDRRITLSRIERRIERMAGVEHLVGEAAVSEALLELASSATESVRAIGAKSTAAGYLQELARRVQDGRLAYYRLLTGDHITHELHTHLSPLLASTLVRVAWQYSERYGTFAVSENEVVRVESTARLQHLVGFRMVAPTSIRLHADLYTHALADSLRIGSDNALTHLCEKCSPTSDRTKASLRATIQGMADMS